MVSFQDVMASLMEDSPMEDSPPPQSEEDTEDTGGGIETPPPRPTLIDLEADTGCQYVLHIDLEADTEELVAVPPPMPPCSPTEPDCFSTEMDSNDSFDATARMQQIQQIPQICCRPQDSQMDSDDSPSPKRLKTISKSDASLEQPSLAPDSLDSLMHHWENPPPTPPTVSYTHLTLPTICSV